MIEVTHCHLPEDVARIASDWFAGRIETFSILGERSVVIPVPGQPCRLIKIKGAGLNGGGIDFGTYLSRGPVAPLFDFDGRRMVDVATGHDGAFVGGCSHQQAVIEWAMTRKVAALGYRAMPCPGYGSVFDGTHRSWFSVFEMDADWILSARPPQGTIDDYRVLALRMGEITLDLAVRHGLIGFAWLIRDSAGGTILKDLHPFRQADPLNMSRQAWVMQTIYALHINAINSRILCDAWYGGDSDPEAPLWLFRAACPAATLEDWDDLRFRVVAPYMLRPLNDFHPERLADLIDANPIAASLTALCPPGYAPLR